MEVEQPKVQDKEEEKIAKSEGDKNVEELSAAALKHKEEGNARFVAKNYSGAVEEYSKGIELIEKELGDDIADIIEKSSPELRNTYVILLNNRSNCFNNLKEYTKSLADCDRAIKADPKSSKAYYRRGIALSELERYDEAISALNDSLAYTEGQKEKLSISKKITEIRKKLNQNKAKMFLNAIHVDSPSSGPTKSYMASSVTSSANRSTWDAEIDQLGSGSRGWWRAEGRKPSEIFAENVAKATANGVVTKENSAKIANEGERLLTMVEGDTTGPRLSSPPTIEEVKSMVEYFKSNQKMIHKLYAAQIMLDALKTFKDEPPLIDVDIPDNTHFTVCGDVHGQFYDLLHIFEVNGWPSNDNPYLFNGDFVDRGSFSCEVLLTLLALRAAQPKALYMARGNHESINMNLSYGFYGEVDHKLHPSFKALATELFDYLPLAHVLANKVFVVHGGLYMDDNLEPPTLDEIRKIDRVCQPPEEGGLMSDLLWADPQPNPGRTPSRRGIGYSFGPDVTKRFLDKNKLSMIIRSHEVKDGGYELMHDGKLATVFSAPNYCDSMGNMGAFVKFVAPEMKPEFTTFKASDHPSSKPMQYANPLFRFMNGFGGF